MAKVTVKLDLERYRKNVKPARYILANQVLIDCGLYMPLDTGSLQQRSYVSPDSKMVVFPGPYAGYLYAGKKMVNRVTGKGPMLIPNVGFRYKKGTKLKATNTDLRFKRPEATARWFETAKAKHIKIWRHLVAQMMLKR